MPILLRWLAIAAVLVLLLLLCLQHEHAGMKGRCVPIPNLASCILVTAEAAFLCKRYWHSLAVPFVAGIAGVFGIAGQLYGPFGGVVGVLIGILVVLMLP